MTGVEIAANAVTAASIVLAGRNSVHTWWTGVVGCVLFAAVFYEARLYADVALQAFFVVTGVLGWRQWLHGDHDRPLSVSHATRALLIGCGAGGACAAAAYGALLARFTDAYAPFVDSAVLVASVVAQLLLMARRIETWAFWLAVDVVAAPLYAGRGLRLTALLYAAYAVNALVAWRHWRRLERAAQAGTGTGAGTVSP